MTRSISLRGKKDLTDKFIYLIVVTLFMIKKKVLDEEPPKDLLGIIERTKACPTLRHADELRSVMEGLLRKEGLFPRMPVPSSNTLIFRQEDQTCSINYLTSFNGFYLEKQIIFCRKPDGLALVITRIHGELRLVTGYNQDLTVYRFFD